MKKKIYSLLLGLFVTATVHAAPIYEQSFDYGNSVLDFQDDLAGDGWTDNTGVVDYNPSSGLTYDDLNGVEGGGLTYDRNDAGDRNARQATSYDFAGDAAGEEYWLFALGRIDGVLSGSTEIRLDGGSAVNTIGFGFNTTEMYGTAWSTGSGNQLIDVSGGAYILEDTIGFLAKVTKGSGSSPSDTVVDFWFNPDLSNLGTADGSITDSKFAREGAGNALNETFYGGDTSGEYTWDEVTFTQDFNDIYTIPEPGSLALVGIALGGLLLFRRKY